MGIDAVWLQEKLERTLNDAERAALEAIMEVVNVPKGCKIMEQGQPGGILYIVRSGKAVVQHDGPNPVEVGSVEEGAVLGEMSFLTEDPASASVIARTDSVVYRIARQGFCELMAQQHELAFALLAFMLRHTAAVIRNMNENHVSMHQYIAGGRMGF